MKAATQGMVRTKLKTSFYRIQVYISLPAGKFKLGKWEFFAKLVLDDEGETETENKVRECEVEDENVPSASHLFLSNYCRQYKTVTQDLNGW